MNTLIVAQLPHGNLVSTPSEPMFKAKPIKLTLATPFSWAYSKLFATQLQGRRHITLVYTLHKPSARNVLMDKSPLIILHGLFGSKQNNRSVSK